MGMKALDVLFLLNSTMTRIKPKSSYNTNDESVSGRVSMKVDLDEPIREMLLAILLNFGFISWYI